MGPCALFWRPIAHAQGSSSMTKEGRAYGWSHTRFSFKLCILMACTKAYLRLSRRTQGIGIIPGRVSRFRVRLASSSALWRVQREEKNSNYIPSRDAHAAPWTVKWQLFVRAGVMMCSTASVAVAGDALSLSPAVKYIVNTNCITQSDLSLIKPSGPKARILKG